MPSSRQYRIIALIALLTILVLYYTTNGERITHSGEFYRRTLAAIEHKKDAAARQHIIEEEKQRLERVERLQKEHDAAMATATSEIVSAATIKVDGGRAEQGEQKPMVDDMQKGENQGERSVAGRKKITDGKKIVGERPAGDSNDGVAREGPNAVKGSGEETNSVETHQVEAELNDILKKGLIIIFSKSYCPYSKKAKHILLDLYDITPAPYVVELDQHELGQGIQNELQKLTGRRTVPNVLINAKSIGGGDDIQFLHQNGKLIETIKTLGGKRILSMSANPQDGSEQRAEVKFKL